MTDKQERFVEEYLIDFNATQAAIRAGYSERTAHAIGWEQLRKPAVRAAIDQRIERLSMSAAEATMRLTEMGRGSLRPFHRLTGDGKFVVDLTTAEAQLAFHLVKKVKQTELRREGVIEVHTELEIHDAKDAVLNILKLHGKFNNKTEMPRLLAFLRALSPEEAGKLAELPDEELAKVLPPDLLK